MRMRDVEKMDDKNKGAVLGQVAIDEYGDRFSIGLPTLCTCIVVRLNEILMKIIGWTVCYDVSMYTKPTTSIITQQKTFFFKHFRFL